MWSQLEKLIERHKHYSVHCCFEGGAPYCKTCTLSITPTTISLTKDYLKEQVTLNGFQSAITSHNGRVTYETASTSPTHFILPFKQTHQPLYNDLD